MFQLCLFGVSGVSVATGKILVQRLFYRSSCRLSFGVQTDYLISELLQFTLSFSFSLMKVADAGASEQDPSARGVIYLVGDTVHARFIAT